jgi:hypothetical protein
MKNFFQSVQSGFISAVKWFAGFFEDIKKSASSKRAIGYIATYLLGVIVYAAKDGKWESNAMNMQIFWGILIIVLFVINAISKEAVSKLIGNFTDKKEDTSK